MRQDLCLCMCVCAMYIWFDFYLSLFLDTKASPALCSDNAESYFCEFFLGAFALSTWKSSAAVCLTWYLDSLKTLTFSSLGFSRIFMSSRGIVSAESEIPGNRHRWVIAMPSHSAGSGGAFGLGSPKGTKGMSWYSWSTEVDVGEGVNGTVRNQHKIEISLGSRLGSNLVVTLWVSYVSQPLPFSLFCTS